MFSEKLSSLIDVKTIVTFVVTAIFAYLAAIGKMEVKDFMLIAVMVFTYFFTKQPAPPATTITSETTTTETTIPPAEK